MGTGAMATEADFQEAMLNTYNQAKKLKYNATYFKQMIDQHGGVNAAKELIHNPDPSYGFTRLWELHRLDLTAEALALREEFRHLFTDEDLAAAKKKLTDLGYHA